MSDPGFPKRFPSRRTPSPDRCSARSPTWCRSTTTEVSPPSSPRGRSSCSGDLRYDLAGCLAVPYLFLFLLRTTVPAISIAFLVFISLLVLLCFALQATGGTGEIDTVVTRSWLPRRYLLCCNQCNPHRREWCFRAYDTVMVEIQGMVDLVPFPLTRFPLVTLAKDSYTRV